MHQYYATNRRIDADELERRRPEVEGFPLLASVFHRLEIVSWLGDTDRNNDLWETINNSRNHLQATLAQLVLSYNMLPADCDESISESLKKQIAHTLGLNFEVKQLKSYGSENQFTEFKSSLVYPARKRNEKSSGRPRSPAICDTQDNCSFHELGRRYTLYRCQRQDPLRGRPV